MMNSKTRGQKRSKYGGNGLLIPKTFNQRKISFSLSSQEGTSSGRYDFKCKGSTKGTSKKYVTVQQPDKANASSKLSDKNQDDRRPSLTEKKAKSKDLYGNLSSKKADPRKILQPCEQSIPRSCSRNVERFSLRKCIGNDHTKQQSKVQPTEIKQVQLQNHAAQISHYSKDIVDSKHSHKQFSSSSVRPTDNTQDYHKNGSRLVDRKPLQLQPAVTKPDTFDTKLTDSQGTYSTRKGTVNDQKGPLTAYEKFSERSSSFCSVSIADYSCASSENNLKNDFSEQLRPQPTVTQCQTSVENVSSIHSRVLSNNTEQPTNPRLSLHQTLAVNEERKLSIVKEISFGRCSSFCSVRQAEDISPDNNSRRNTDNEQLHSPLRFTGTNTFQTQQPLERNSLFNIRDTADDKRRLATVRELSFGRCSSFCSVRQPDNVHASDEIKPKNVEKQQLQLQSPYLNIIRDVSIRTKKDIEPCQITGFCQLQNGTIVLTEFNNKAIKTLNCQNYRVIDTMPLSNYPLDICTMEESKALVVMSESPSQCRCICINVHDSIELKREKVLKHDCICVAYCNEKMFVGNSKCKGVYIYDKNWNKLDIISNDLVGTDEIFSNQFSISVSVHDNETTIYIADEDNGMHSIIDTGLEIENRWKFKDHESFKATGMCSDSKGDIFLVDRDSQRLIKMNTAGMILAILLDNRNGNESIIIPLHNKKNNNLIISLSGKDFIRVFDFK